MRRQSLSKPGVSCTVQVALDDEERNDSAMDVDDDDIASLGGHSFRLRGSGRSIFQRPADQDTL